MIKVDEQIVNTILMVLLVIKMFSYLLLAMLQLFEKYILSTG